MVNSSKERKLKVRIIKIADLSDRGIFYAYQHRTDSPICELKTEKSSFWEALVNLNESDNMLCDINDYDATLISIDLRPLYDNKDSAIDFSAIKHLLSLIYNIKMVDTVENKKQLDKERKVYVCFRQKCNGFQQDYFKLSEVLRLWVVQNYMYNYIRFYDETDRAKSNNDNSKTSIKVLAASYSNKAKPYTYYVSGSLCPIISINHRAYEILDGVYNLPNQNQKKKMGEILSSLRDKGYKYEAEEEKPTPDEYLGSYLYAFIEKVFDKARENFGKFDNSILSYSTLLEKKWVSFIENYKPSVLVVLLLSTIIKDMASIEHGEINQKNKKGNKDICTVNDILSDDNWVAIVERCYSYAQGIIQLIANANEHVVEKKNKYGELIGNGAFFGFRVRTDKNNILKFTSDDHLSKCNFFLEMIVTDCDFSGEAGIIVNYNNKLKEGYKEVDCTETIKALKEVFDYPLVESEALKAYYSHTNNIAFHYGLQIFSGVVSSGKGFLYVVSGGECNSAEKLQKITYYNDENNYKVSYIGDGVPDSMRLPNPSVTPIQYNLGHNEEQSEVLNFSGTSYTILLPVAMLKLKDSGYNFFLGNEHIGVKPDQDLRLCNITLGQNNVYNVKNVISKDFNGEQILNIDFTDISKRRQIELACKNSLVAFVEIPEIKALCFTGFKNEYALLDAVRIISLFYNKSGRFDQIKNKGIFLYCRYKQAQDEKDREYELYFNGSNLDSIFANIQRQKLVRDVSNLFIHELEAFLYRNKKSDKALSEKREENIDSNDISDGPLSAAIIKYYLKPYGNEDTIIQRQIKDILNNDIHDSPLGCKIENTHVRIGKVHLDTFYEAQFLFGNAYCTDIFALYVAEQVEKQINRYIDEHGVKYDKIILYGYESYSTLTLYKAQGFLDNKNCKIKMLVYEKVNERVRYLNDDLLHGNALVVYVMGISSTLSTFKQMNEAFSTACEKQRIPLNNVEKLCLSIIQIDGDGSEKFIIPSKEPRVLAYKSVDENSFIDFAIGKRAYYFVSAQSKWYAAENEVCIHCLPEQSQTQNDKLTIYDERPLIEVDDTSVVPTQMIFLKKSNESKDIDYDDGRKNALNFLKNEENAQYLRYGHIERYDNHFQYFFRIAALYHDKQNLNENGEEIGIEQWLKSVRNKLPDAFDTNDNTINILIAPQHFSNTGYVNSVARWIFGDTAHIIELDIRKEYRSNFRTKYSNYHELAKFVNEEGKRYKLNFYYVNDQIITGRTFKRAESLINTLLGKNGIRQNGKTFRGVFTLVDRNSYETRKAYVEPIVTGNGEYLPFFSYLRFNIPSLRNHDNSCPLCAQNKVAEDIVSSAAFTSTAHYWQEKIVYHKQRTSDEVRDIDEKQKEIDIEKYNDKKMRNFRRLQCENDLWIQLNRCKDRESAYNSLLQVILSRYPGNEIIALMDENKLFDFIRRLEKEAPDLYFSLFKLTIARLCAVGSCSLLNHERLMFCLKLGNYLEHQVTSKSSVNGDILKYGEYLISYIKVMSRPLLFYREPVKWAVLKLLLKILNVFLTQERDFLSYKNLNNVESGNVYYDQTFNGFLLNALKRLLEYDKGVSKCNYCDEYAFNRDKNGNPEFDGEYAEFFKRLYIENNRYAHIECMKKLKLKEQCILKLSERIHDNNNLIAELNQKCQDKNTKEDKEKAEKINKESQECEEMRKERLFNQIQIDKCGNITEKYDYIALRLNCICFDRYSKKDIAFFIVRNRDIKNDDKNIDYTLIGGDKGIKVPENNHSKRFYFQEGIYYVDIGNNYTRLHNCDENAVYGYCEQLGLVQDVCVVMGVRTTDMKTLRRILSFRKEILLEAGKDFNNGIVNELSLSKKVAEVLTSSLATTHNSSPHMPYGRLFRQLGDNLEAQCDVLSAYMSLIISEYYRDLVKRYLDRDGITVPTADEKIENEDSTNKYFDINVADIQPTKNFAKSVGTGAAPFIAFAVKMINYKINNQNTVENHYKVKVEMEFDGKDLLQEKEEEIIRRFEGYNLYDQFRNSPKDVMTVFMILDTLIKNAESHCKASKRKDVKVNICFDKKCDKCIDLVVKNTYNQSDDLRTGKGITLDALANLFGTRVTKDYKSAYLWHSRLGVPSGQSYDGDTFEVRIYNYLFKY